MSALIGITGGIGAGKSVVSRILRCQGYEVYDCDSEARRLMDRSDFVKSSVARVLGPDCLREDSSLDREVIAERVFADPSRLDWLNGLVHGLVREDLVQRLAQHSLRSASPFFVESAILHTSGLDLMCDRIWLVVAPDALRLQRAAVRDACDEKRITDRMKAQEGEFTSLDPKKLVIISNDGACSLLTQIGMAASAADE